MHPKLVLRESYIKTTVELAEGLYVGPLIDGQPQGTGTLIYTRDDPAGQKRYDGAFHLGKRQGHGKLVWKNKEQYEGDFADDKITGFGVMIRNGEEYMGKLVNGEYEGYGQLKKKGALYAGYFKKNLPDGYCEQTTATDSYKGNWVNGAWHGQGLWTLTTAIGETETFEGTFRHGEKWAGIYTNGTYSCVYREGKAVAAPCCVIL